jgi:hypothetical protein
MFRTPNEAHQYIAEMIQSRDFKNCVHLTVIDVSDYSSKPWVPHCQKDSFCRPKNYDQCHRDCLLFEDKEAVEKAQQVSKHRESRRTFWRAFWRTAAIPFNWFSSLSGITQALILILLIVYFFRGLAKTVLEIWKAVK